MNKILEKIYLEKDDATNIALFFASVVAAVLWWRSSDQLLTIILAIGIFSLIKTIVLKIVKVSTNDRHDIDKNFSNEEQEIIRSFIKRGTCFIDMKEINGSDDFCQLPFNSLVGRGIIKFTESGEGLETGFMLNEVVYKKFL